MTWQEKLSAAIRNAGQAYADSLRRPPRKPAPEPEPIRYQFRPPATFAAPFTGLPGGAPSSPTLTSSVASALTLSPAEDTNGPEPTPEPARPDHLRELFHSALTAETPEALVDFAEFCSRFRRYSIFNARLIQTQRRGARACATVKEWRATGRYVLPDAQPIIILWPFGPVAHVYDIEDTGPPHDRDVIGDPFAATSALDPQTIAVAVDRLVKACAGGTMFHIQIIGERLGFGFAGSATHQGSLPLAFSYDAITPKAGRVETIATAGKAAPGTTKTRRRWVPSWRIKVNDRLTPAEQLVTIAHELGHILCGHLGGCEGRGSTRGWANRSGLGHHEREMEAEAVAWLVAHRAGITTKSAAYLRRHVAEGNVGSVNTDVVIRAAARVETLAGLRYATRQQ